MVDEAQTSTMRTSTADDIPVNFSLRQMLEEMDGTIRSRRDALQFKLERNRIGGPEANLARYSIARLQAIERLLKMIAAGEIALPGEVLEATETEERGQREAAQRMLEREKQVDEKPAPLPQTLPLEEKTVVQQPAKVAEPVDDWDDP